MRLIDADALIDDLGHGLWGKDWDKALAEAIIRDAPTIDAVPVVRCGECKHLGDVYTRVNGEVWCFCSEIATGTQINGYCWMGERMDLEGEQ